MSADRIQHPRLRLRVAAPSNKLGQTLGHTSGQVLNAQPARPSAKKKFSLPRPRGHDADEQPRLTLVNIFGSSFPSLAVCVVEVGRELADFEIPRRPTTPRSLQILSHCRDNMRDIHGSLRGYKDPVTD